jgi:hypothetical protein
MQSHAFLIHVNEFIAAKASTFRLSCRATFGGQMRTHAEGAFNDGFT